MASTNHVDEIKITSLKRGVTNQFWLFDGVGRSGPIAGEVELLARRCKTWSPNALKEQLIHENRPNSEAGVPIINHSRRSTTTITRRKIHAHAPTPDMPKNESCRRALQKFQPPEMKEISIGPGYVLSKGKNEILAKIKTDYMLEAKSVNSKSQILLPVSESWAESGKESPISGNLTDELKKKADDLAADLEEEKFRCRVIIDQINEDHQRELDKLQSEHEEHVRAVELDHADHVRDIEERHTTIITALESRATRERDELSKELQGAQSALAIYKENIAKELKSKWQEHRLELELEYGRKTDNQLAIQKTELQSEKNRALDAMTKEHRRHISKIVESNRKEIDVLLKKFTSSFEEAKQLKEIMADFKQVKSENEQFRSELEKAQSLNRSLQNQLHDVKVELNMFKDHFTEKIAEVEERYAHKIHNLMIDNSKIRQQYLKKCDELYRVKSDIESHQVDSLLTAKDALQKIILSRTRADVSLTALRDDAAADASFQDEQWIDDQALKPDTEKRKKRPASAPSTNRETRQAVRDTANGTNQSASAIQLVSRPTSSFNRQTPIASYEGRTSELLQHFSEENLVNTSLSVKF